MADYSTFGSVLKHSTSGSEFTTIAGIIGIDGYGAKNAKVAAVPVNGIQTWISGGLTEYSDVKIKGGFDKSVVSTYENYLTSGSAKYYQISLANTRTYQFQALVTGFNVGAVDLQKPDLQTCEMILSPSGSVVIS